MELFTFTGVALFALLVMVLPALAHKYHWSVIREDWRDPLRMLFGVLTEELGAVTVTYYSRGGVVTQNASTTAITASAASQVMRQSAIVVFGVTGDVQALFTHNWGLDASAPLYGEPEIIWSLISTALTTYCPLITFDRTNTNVLAVNKPSTGDACTIRLCLRRPHSTGQ